MLAGRLLNGVHRQLSNLVAVPASVSPAAQACYAAALQGSRVPKIPDVSRYQVRRLQGWDRNPLGSGTHSRRFTILSSIGPSLWKNDVSVESECEIVVRCSAHAAVPETLVHVGASTEISWRAGGAPRRAAQLSMGVS
ncbi:uncharacterized protein TrAFT101_002706 [Trichoderma asperellum]|uniref:Uncharacterized protein n=1 Tax=Trichoderma asperellum (strain ATCC 204424 / CBS 433.97 / NBRC 101777) TaxID=1042311 RepID=A0A2T3ZH68_TRIA4|nr:hypothetical protein M441DRAFT_342391 [Trichoderma asperellum CBS 433.97]PTB44149.1 hypothetical protein M441DRAFT_342391 [Trichoderma asperellum CBS 433.97]UKZ86883.1 hypothetical protein TrAFT101_002706 [Trichoderma asperellum]